MAFAISVQSGAAVASDPQADAFASIYASICLKHLTNLDAVREKLKAVPELSSDKAAAFLNGSAGSAWPVPDKHGTFVVAIPAGKNMCSVFARRVNTEAAADRFTGLVQNAPKPLIGRQTKDERKSSAKNGDMRTVSYEWSVQGAQRKMLFTLTTATATTAEIQGLATAAVAQ